MTECDIERVDLVRVARLVGVESHFVRQTLSADIKGPIPAEFERALCEAAGFNAIIAASSKFNYGANENMARALIRRVAPFCRKTPAPVRS